MALKKFFWWNGLIGMLHSLLCSEMRIENTRSLISYYDSLHHVICWNIMFNSHFIVTNFAHFHPGLKWCPLFKDRTDFFKCIFAQGLLLEIRWVIWLK